MGQKTLIIPDIHLRSDQAQKIIDYVSPDLIIFLGDAFDNFGDTPKMIEKTAIWFKNIVNDKKTTFLLSNHDISYWFKNNFLVRCSGYEDWKSRIINDIVSEKDWEKLKFFHILDNKWLLSHAGINPDWLTCLKTDNLKMNGKKKKIDLVREELEFEEIKARKMFYSNQLHWFDVAGFSRSRNRCYGGLLWLDFNDEFFPIRGIHQIVGHSPQRNLIWKNMKENDDRVHIQSDIIVNNDMLTENNSYNVCLDSEPGSRYYAIYQDGIFTTNYVDTIISSSCIK